MLVTTVTNYKNRQMSQREYKIFIGTYNKMKKTIPQKYNIHLFTK